MEQALLEREVDLMDKNIQPLCAVFGECGGCQYQDIPYEQELKIKEDFVKDIFKEANVPIDTEAFCPIVPSPKEYHYRNRLDLQLLRIKNGDMFIGFSPANGFKIISVDQCPIARKEISEFIPRLKEEAHENLPKKYRIASLVVRSGDNGVVRWGGIGKGSLKLNQSQYFWTEIEKCKIYYSLDTFFQANLYILPALMKTIESFGVLDKKTVLYDIYAGVGLFSLCLASKAKKVFLIEEVCHSIKCAQFNLLMNRIPNIEICEGRTEDVLPKVYNMAADDNKVAIVDPPRAGLSESASEFLSSAKKFKNILYLSCNVQTLARDLKQFVSNGWEITSVTPFDFFPRTKHVEVLVLLSAK